MICGDNCKNQITWVILICSVIYLNWFFLHFTSFLTSNMCNDVEIFRVNAFQRNHNTKSFLYVNICKSHELFFFSKMYMYSHNCNSMSAIFSCAHACYLICWQNRWEYIIRKRTFKPQLQWKWLSNNHIINDYRL